MEQSNRGLPDWVTGELSGFTDDSLAVDLLKDRPSSTPVAAHHRYFTTLTTGAQTLVSNLQSPCQCKDSFGTSYVKKNKSHCFVRALLYYCKLILKWE